MKLLRSSAYNRDTGRIFIKKYSEKERQTVTVSNKMILQIVQLGIVEEPNPFTRQTMIEDR